MGDCVVCVMDNKVKILEDIYAHILKDGAGPNARRFLVSWHEHKGLVEELERDRFIRVDDSGRYALQVRHLKLAGPWKKDRLLADKVLTCFAKMFRDDPDRTVPFTKISVEAKKPDLQRVLRYLSDLAYISVDKSEIKDGVRSIAAFRILMKVLDCPTIESGLRDYEKLVAGQFLPSEELVVDGKPVESGAKEKSVDEGSNVVYRLSYNEMTLKLKVSGTFKAKDGATLKKTVELARPHLDSENDIVIGFLIKNPNRSFSKAELEKKISEKRREKFVLHKPLPKIPEKLGFTGDLKIFLNAGVRGIRLKNPITRKDLNLEGIDYLSIPS